MRKPHWACLLTGCAFLLAGCSSILQERRLFPLGTFRWDEVVNEHYSRHLRSFGEHALHGASPRLEGTLVYRLLYLPTFDRPVCIKIEWNGLLREGRITVKVTRGRGGYEEGPVRLLWQRALTEREFAEIDALARDMGFWQMDTVSAIDRLGVCTLDGIDYILEGRTQDRYHVVSRPDTGTVIDEHVASRLRDQHPDFDLASWQDEDRKFAAFCQHLFHMRLVPEEHDCPVMLVPKDDWPWSAKE